MRDIAIAGGGPAGSACAALLARDHDVTVFEEHACIGRPMQCAGLISDEAIKLSGVSPDVFSVFYGAEVVFPDGTSLAIRSKREKARSVDRSDFDSKLADRALAAGAEYRMCEHVDSFSVGDGVTVRTSEGDHGFRLLVGADGHTSAVSRCIGNNGAPQFLRGIQADVGVRMEHQDLFRMHLGSRYAPGFFTWEIPCGDFTRVGLCTEWSAGPPHQYLKRLISDLGYEGKVTGMHCGKIPIGRVRTLVGDRVMLIGDAASQVKPVSGGGIYPSMVAAPMLAGVAGAALGEDDLSSKRLSEYEARFYSAMGRELLRGYRLRKVYQGMDDADLDRAGRYARDERVLSIVNELEIDRPTEVISRLMRHPAVAAKGLWTLLRCLI